MTGAEEFQQLGFHVYNGRFGGDDCLFVTSGTAGMRAIEKELYDFCMHTVAYIVAKDIKFPYECLWIRSCDPL